jgi:hypothetical protein
VVEDALCFLVIFPTYNAIGVSKRKTQVMNKGIVVLLMLGLSFSAFTCEDSLDLPCPNNDWLETKVKEIKRASWQEGLIEQYEYEGQVVISINNCVNCSDAMTVVYDCSGNELCKFGGIAGYNTCPDFATEAKFIKVIFKS